MKLRNFECIYIDIVLFGTGMLIFISADRGARPQSHDLSKSQVQPSIVWGCGFSVKAREIPQERRYCSHPGLASKVRTVSHG